jgi:4a-hydroxytetrahydrobiopterin dehydratase
MSWKSEDNRLTKEFQFKNFVGAVRFINDILPLAEEMNHHPDILIHSYKKVKVMLFTHSEQSITDKDHAMAEKIDSLLS